MDKIYSWDFEAIYKNYYFFINGIYYQSNYTDCLAEEYARQLGRSSKSFLYFYIPERRYMSLLCGVES